MFLYEKRIAYLSLYEAGEKVCSAGFVSLSLEKEEICVIMQIRNVGREKKQSYPVFLLTESQRIDVGTIFIEAGRGNCERKFYFHEGRASVNNLKIKPDEICAIEKKYFETLNREPSYSYSKAPLVIGIIIAIIGAFVLLSGDLTEKLIGLPITALGIIIIIWRVKTKNKKESEYDENYKKWNNECTMLLAEVENYI